MMSRLVGLAVVGVVALGLGACGDNNKQNAAGGVGTYCKAVITINIDQGPNADFSSLSPAEQKAVVRKYATDKLVPEAEAVQKATPKEIKSEIDTLIGAVRKLETTGDYDAAFTNDPKVRAADKRAHAYDLGHCGWARQDISATEYAYAGAPASRPRGIISFEFTNRGGEKHELNVLRLNDGVTESFADIIKLPQPEAKKKTEHINSTDAEPGKSDYVLGDLRAGRYVLACFLPVGGKEGAPTHASKGMFAEFTVS